jgi:HD superfamily phosphohydrolase
LGSTTVGEFFGGSGRRIRDPVWGDVPIDRAARTLLESEVMARLKGMSQLGFVFNSFPSARHTRFDHAIGVYHLTRLTLKRIMDSGAYLEDRDVRGALAAALLLDAGRYPYAGATEGIFLPNMPSRKELCRRAIEETEVAKILRSEWDLEPHNVYRLASRFEEPPRGLTPTEHLIRDILFGSLDAYTLDGLVRDAKGTRSSYGTLDVATLVERLRIVGQDNRAVLAVDEEGVSSLQSLFFTRYLMRYNVYGHHALRIPGVMFLRAAQDAIQAELVSPERLAAQDDAGAFIMVQDATEPDSATAVLMKRLADRIPYRRALEIDERHPSYASLMRLREDASWRKRVEEAWARYLTRYRKGVAGPYDILIDLPTSGRVSMDLRLIRRSPLPGERNPVNWQSLSGMTEEDVTRFHAPLRRVRIATANDDLATSVRRHAEELFTIAEEVG